MSHDLALPQSDPSRPRMRGTAGIRTLGMSRLVERFRSDDRSSRLQEPEHMISATVSLVKVDSLPLEVVRHFYAAYWPPVLAPCEGEPGQRGRF